MRQVHSSLVGGVNVLRGRGSECCARALNIPCAALVRRPLAAGCHAETANTINKLAAGIADTYALDLLTEAVGARQGVVILPFVNAALAARRPFIRSVDGLREEGVSVLIGPGKFEPHSPRTGSDRIDEFPWSLALDEAEDLFRTRGPSD